MNLSPKRNTSQLETTVPVLVMAYPGLSLEHITGHEHIAPGRKTDPGPLFRLETLESYAGRDVACPVTGTVA